MPTKSKTSKALEMKTEIEYHREPTHELTKFFKGEIEKETQDAYIVKVTQPKSSKGKTHYVPKKCVSIKYKIKEK